jgi:hypothetical protein
MTMAKQAESVDDADTGASGDDSSVFGMGVDDNLLDAFEASAEEADEEALELRRPDRADDDDGDDEDGEGEEAAAGRRKKTDKDEDDEEDDDEKEARAKGAEDDEHPETGDDDDAEGDYVEHEGKKISVDELLAAHKFKQDTEPQLEQIRQRVFDGAAQKVEEARTEWGKRFEQLDQAYAFISALIPEIEDPPVTMLQRGHADYDPDAYHQLKDYKAQVEAAKQKAAEAVKTARETKARDDAGKTQQQIQAAARAFIAKHPEWADQKVGKQKSDELFGLLQDTYGFSQQEINGIMDPRIFEVLLDAKAYRDLKKKPLPKPEKTAAKAGKSRIVRASAKGAPAGKASGERSVNATREKRALERVRKTGKVEDLEALYGRFVP